MQIGVIRLHACEGFLDTFLPLIIFAHMETSRILRDWYLMFPVIELLGKDASPL